MMRVMARGAWLKRHGAQIGIPIKAGPTMHTGLPITERGPVATATERWAVGNVQLAAVPCLQGVEFGFVVAVETVVVSTMRSVAHDNIFMLGRNDDIPAGIIAHSGGLAFLVADITLEI